MKTLLFALFLFGLTTLFGADFTNGVFYIDNSVECHFVAQTGTSTTNQLAAGNTFTVGNTLSELCSTSKTMIYFSGGVAVETITNSVLTINLFDQEVNNINDTPRAAVFGNHNLSLTLGNGEFVVIDPSVDSNSSLVINTPIATYQSSGGKFLFQVSDQKCLVYVIEGMIQVHGDKNRVDSAKKGKLAIAGQIEDTVATTTRDIKPTENNSVSTSISNTEKKTSNVQFFIIQGKVVGIWMKKLK